MTKYVLEATVRMSVDCDSDQLDLVKESFCDQPVGLLIRDSDDIIVKEREVSDGKKERD